MALNSQFLSKHSNTSEPDQALVTKIKMMAGDSSGESTSTSDELCEESIGVELLGKFNGKLRLGARYTSFAQLQKAVHLYSQQRKIRLFKSDSRKLKSAHIRVNPVVIENAPECLIYYSLTYSCAFGSKSKNRIRDLQPLMCSRNRGCKFSVRIGLTKDYRFLEVVKMSDPSVHSHFVPEFSDRSTFSSCPQKCQAASKSGTFSSSIGSSDVSSNPTHTENTPSSPMHSGVISSNPKNSGIIFSNPVHSAVTSSNPMHSGIISSKLQEFRSSGLFCDTVILASDGTVFAHSAILGMFCPKLFATLNQKPFQTRQSNMIDLSKYPADLINKLLDFFYVGKLCMENFGELQELGSHLGVAFKVNDGSSCEDSSSALSSDCEDPVHSDRESFVPNDRRQRDKASGKSMRKVYRQTTLSDFVNDHKSWS